MDTTQILFSIDCLLAAAACVVLIVVGRRLQKTSPRAGTIHWPPRSNTLKEDAILLAVIGYIAGATLLSIVGSYLWADEYPVRTSLLIGSGSQIIGAVVCIGLANSRFSGGARAFLFGARDGALDDARPSPVICTVLAVVCAWGLCPVVLNLTTLAIQWVYPGFQLPEHPTINALSSGDQPAAIVVFLWVGAAVIAPMAEEIFFRGFVQTLLVSLMRSRSAAILSASLIFAGIHFPQQPHAVPALFVLACILGYTYERTGALWPAILVHGLFNLKTLLWHHLGGVAG